MATNLRSLRVRQVEERVRSWREHLEERPPPGGWIKVIRKALGMSTRQLAKRLGITQQAVTDLERRERDGRATIDALTKAARAMGAELVYAIVPATGLEEMIRKRARTMAQRRIGRVAHSMELEDQGTSAEERERQITALTADLIASPRDLWNEVE